MSDSTKLARRLPQPGPACVTAAGLPRDRLGGWTVVFYCLGCEGGAAGIYGAFSFFLSRVDRSRG